MAATSYCGAHLSHLAGGTGQQPPRQHPFIDVPRISARVQEVPNKVTQGRTFPCCNSSGPWQWPPQLWEQCPEASCPSKWTEGAAKQASAPAAHQSWHCQGGTSAAWVRRQHGVMVRLRPVPVPQWTWVQGWTGVQGRVNRLRFAMPGQIQIRWQAARAYRATRVRHLHLGWRQSPGPARPLRRILLRCPVALHGGVLAKVRVNCRCRWDCPPRRWGGGAPAAWQHTGQRNRDSFPR